MVTVIRRNKKHDKNFIETMELPLPPSPPSSPPIPIRKLSIQPFHISQFQEEVEEIKDDAADDKDNEDDDIEIHDDDDDDDDGDDDDNSSDGHDEDDGLLDNSPSPTRPNNIATADVEEEHHHPSLLTSSSSVHKKRLRKKTKGSKTKLNNNANSIITPSHTNSRCSCWCYPTSYLQLHNMERVGNMYIFATPCYYTNGWGVAGPHWFGPPCVLGIIVTSTAYCIPVAYHHVGIGSAIICFCFSISCIYFLINTSYRDPGIVRSTTSRVNKTNAGLSLPHPPPPPPSSRHRWCEYCHTYQPPSGAHCQDCNVCVTGYDHHCVWMGTCIGQGNIRPFARFNMSWFLYLLYIIVWVTLLGPSFKHRHRHHHHHHHRIPLLTRPSSSYVSHPQVWIVNGTTNTNAVTNVSIPASLSSPIPTRESINDYNNSNIVNHTNVGVRNNDFILTDLASLDAAMSPMPTPAPSPLQSRRMN
jgi:hypothetical protein